MPTPGFAKLLGGTGVGHLSSFLKNESRNDFPNDGQKRRHWRNPEKKHPAHQMVKLKF